MWKESILQHLFHYFVEVDVQYFIEDSSFINHEHCPLAFSMKDRKIVQPSALSKKLNNFSNPLTMVAVCQRVLVLGRAPPLTISQAWPIRQPVLPAYKQSERMIER